MRSTVVILSLSLFAAAPLAIADDATTTPATPSEATVTTAPTTAPATTTEGNERVRRTNDAEIEYRIGSRLGSLPAAHLASVQVQSVRGAVTLRGTVPNNQVREALLVRAATTEGVTVVRDELGVAPAESARGGGPVDDAQIIERVRASVNGHDGVVGRPLEVTSQNGVVTLRGHVATFRDANQVLERVMHVEGVRNVRPAFTVNESVVIEVDGDRNARRANDARSNTRRGGGPASR